MKIRCKKCKQELEAHQIGRIGIPFVIIQCPNCCFIDTVMSLEEFMLTVKVR